LTYGLSKLFGGFSLPVALLPSAVASAGTVATVWRIGALHSREYGFIAAFLLLSTVGFLIQARTTSLDAWVMFSACLCFYLTVAAILKGSQIPLVKLLLLIFLAAMFRGAIGGVIATGVVSAVLLVNRRWKELFLHGFCAALVIAMAFALLIAAAYLEGGREFVDRAVDFQFSRRFGDPDSGFAVYFRSAMGYYAISYPLALIAIIAIASKGKPSASAYTLLLISIVAWLVVVVLGMSIPGTKKTRYILAAAPAMALLAGALLVKAREYHFPRVRRAVLIFLGASPLIICITLLVLSRSELADDLSLQSNLMRAAAISLLLALGSYLSLRKLQDSRQLWAILVIFTLTVMSAKYIVEEPGQQRHESDQEFVSAIQDYRNSIGSSRLGFYRLGPEYQDMNYLVVLNSAERPVYAGQAADIDVSTSREPLILVLLAKNLALFSRTYQGPWEEIVRGRLGHKDCVALRLN
jgi:4-amino-4-deoxy-L-arabinose transferase-like glycosyltransferase